MPQMTDRQRELKRLRNARYRAAHLEELRRKESERKARPGARARSRQAELRYELRLVFRRWSWEVSAAHARRDAVLGRAWSDHDSWIESLDRPGLVE